MDKKIIQIAIDGPAGVGKSTVAKGVAKKLNILYLDTGAMYRAIALYASGKNIHGNDNNKLAELFESFDLCFSNDRLILNGEDISEKIRTKEIDIKVSEFAVNPFVRSKLVERQREIGKSRSIIMEGRDICSVVLKDAPYKFYFDASAEVRAERRYKQNLARGIECSYEEILSDIIRRDKVDSEREADPLSVAQDAEYINTVNYTVDQLINLVVQRVEG